MSTIPYAHITQGPAVVQPLTPGVVVAPRRQMNILIPLCCLGLILFLIAATIVLALIPVYLRARGSTAETETRGYNVLYRINNGTLPVGALTADNCQVIRQDQQKFAALNNAVSPSVPIVVDCTVTTNTSVTSRRRRQSQQAEANLIVLNGIISGEGDCQRGACLTRRVNAFINSLLARGTFFLTLAGANGTRFVFSITVISAITTPLTTTSRANDIAILNYALTLEHLEANFYTRFQANFTAQNFIAANFTQQNYDYFNIIYVHETAHVRILQAIISQLGGTPVPECTYNFSMVTGVSSYIQTARTLENTGTMAYDGAANGIADPTLREIAATVALVEARHAAYLNLIEGVSPFPSSFETALSPSTVIQAITPFIISCPYTITAPIVPYIGSSSYTGSVPTSNNTAVSTYTNIMYVNDLRALNFALVAEQLESSFYNQYVSNFTSANFIASGFGDPSNYFIMIREIENAHVQFLRLTITQRGGTPVSPCVYNFNVTNVSQFVQTSRAFENTGASAYAGAINTITDPNLILGAATIATVEARFASYLNQLVGLVPFPNITQPTLTPSQVVAILSAYQTCPFTPQLPIVLNPSSFVPNI